MDENKHPDKVKGAQSLRDAAAQEEETIAHTPAPSGEQASEPSQSAPPSQETPDLGRS